MKQSKFGAFDVILAILIVAGIGLNIYAYGFYDKGSPGSELESSRGPGASSSTNAGESPQGGSAAGGSPSGAAESPGETGQPSGAPGGAAPTPTPPTPSSPGATTTPASTPEPQTYVTNTLVFRLNSPNLTVNGQEAAIDGQGSAPFNLDGVSMLPLRATYEMLGGAIEFDSGTGYISALFLDTTLRVKMGETGAEINGTPVTLTVAPENRNGAGYVPARAIADALGTTLAWDGAAQSITLAIPSLSIINPSTLLSPVPEAPPAPQPPPVYTPSGAPTAADFAWFMGGARPAGVPQGAVRITDLDEIMGDWKMLIWIDPDHVVEYESAYFLAMVNISETGGTVSMSIQNLLMVYEDGTTYDLSRNGAEVYTGGYLPTEMGIFTGYDGYMFTITDFYTRDGRQHGIGYQEVQSGEPCYVAFVRP